MSAFNVLLLNLLLWKAVGVNDIDTLIRKVEKNTINEDRNLWSMSGCWKLVVLKELYNKGMMPLSRAALDSIRKQKTFIQAGAKVHLLSQSSLAQRSPQLICSSAGEALESVDVPNIRQAGREARCEVTPGVCNLRRLACSTLWRKCCSSLSKSEKHSAFLFELSVKGPASHFPARSPSVQAEPSTSDTCASLGASGTRGRSSSSRREEGRVPTLLV